MSFKRLDPEDFLVSAQSVSQTCWSGDIPTLEEFFTSSAQESSISGDYFLSVYQTQSEDPAAVTQFQIAFGDKTGRGTVDYNPEVSNLSPSATIYGQYRSLVLEDENATFDFGGITSDYFYVISIERARYKESLFNGSLGLQLSGSTGRVLHLTDNSNDVTTPSFFGVQPYYEIISGSNGTAYNKVSGELGNNTGFTSTSGSYGYYLPDTATLILNGSALDSPINAGGLALGTGLVANTNNENPQKLYIVASGSGNFSLAAQETLTSDFVFIRVRNSEMNYSENPSFISGSTGEVINSYFIQNPQVFPTTIGMYNDGNELLAVAKLSRPIQKDFTKEALIRVKLDF
tara:strand:+ start:1870 stop:2907 length:1038 start_codon:yes stop_codon:yes gene_type:complete